MTSRVEDALALRELGLNLVAAPERGKAPLGSWKRYQQERVPERELREQFAKGRPNLFVITGAISRLAVLDCDDRAAIDWWRERLGEDLERTARVKSGQGYHFYFRLEEGAVHKGRSSNSVPDSGKWDLRAEGGGVIAPPSIHESGRQYEWVPGHGPESILRAPGILLGVGAGDEYRGAGSQSTSTLSQLLANPPAEGGRNNWLAQVAGHYARHLPWVDAYDMHVEEAAAKLSPPLPEEELYKLKQSIWNTELAKQGRLAPDVAVEGEDWREALTEASEESGWLVSGRNKILVQTRIKIEERWQTRLEPWMNADIRVEGVVQTEDQRIYEVELTRADGEIRKDPLPAGTIADQRKLDAWLANHGVSIGVPDDVHPKRMTTNARMMRYLEAQGAPAVIGADALGWHDETKAFLTHDEVIRSEGPQKFQSVRPIVERGWAPYRYGFSADGEAIETLREVLTFHDETVAAVFGSWWAACLLKPQILAKSSQFPFMALEAASESGKTTGFFSLMLQLSGNTEGHNITTRAALRDYLSAHRSGIVWLDDLDSLEYVGEILRASTVEGGLTKKGQDNRGQVAVKMRAALVVSGESLGLGGQKALLDRAILLEVGSPVGRRSIRDPERLQWADIESLRDKYPALSDHAGTLVKRALGQADLVRKLENYRFGAGRHADKLAILRLGARVLIGMLGNDGSDEWIAQRVDEWVQNVDDPGAENTLTLSLIPKALARFGWLERPEGADRHPGGVSATPAFVTKESDEGGLLEETEEETVWFSPSMLAEWWAKETRGRGGKSSQRTESEEALIQQARALGLGGKAGGAGARKLFKLVGGGVRRYWRMAPELSGKVLARSREEEVRND